MQLIGDRERKTHAAPTSYRASDLESDSAESPC
jgi:hypothetical protein